MSLAKLAKQIKKENKLLNRTFEELFLSAVDDYIIDSREEREARRNKHPVNAFRPSGYYKCQRQLWYSMKGYPARKKRFPRSERILEVGTKLHEWVQEDILMDMDKRAGSPVKLIPMTELAAYGQPGIEFIKKHQAADMEIKFKDYRFTTEYPISAMVDGALNFMSKDVLFEFKTINPDDFKLLIEPLQDHIKQGALYSLSLRLPVLFVYLCKGTQQWKAYLIEYGEEQYEWVKARLAEIEGYLSSNELPPVEPDDGCRWCPYKKLCDADMKLEK